MAEKITDIVKNLLDGMHSMSHSDTVVGEPTKVGNATVIPVHRLRVGFTAATVDAHGRAVVTDGKVGGRGLGGTAQVDPVAVLAVGVDGHVRLLTVDGESQGSWQSLLREAPDLVSRLVRKLAEHLEAITTKSEPK